MKSIGTKRIVRSQRLWGGNLTNFDIPNVLLDRKMAAMEANALKSHLFWDDFIKILIRIDDKRSVICTRSHKNMELVCVLICFGINFYLVFLCQVLDI